MSLTIIIPNLNGKELLKKCLNRIREQSTHSYNIVIVDNGSDDGSQEFINNNHPEIILIENNVNRGYAAAVNQAIRSSASNYILLLNNDVFLKPDCIENLLKCIKAEGNIFAVSSKLIQYHNPELMDDAGDEYTILGWTKRVGYGKVVGKYTIPREVFSACAGAALYSRNILDEIGYFDENFFAYLEDVDIAYRARIKGYKSVYCPHAEAYHVGSATSGSQYNEFKIRLAARNNIYIAYKNMPWPQLLLNSPFLGMGFFIKFLFFLQKGFGRTYLAGLKEGLSKLKLINKTRYEGKNLINYLKIEYLLIKNTFKFLFF